MTDNSDKERRRYPRKDVSIDVNYHVLGVIDNIEFAHTKDSSLVGFLLKTDAQIKRGVCLVLEIPWPSRLTPVRLLGRVIESIQSDSSSFFDTRIEFLAMNEETNEHVQRLIDHYLQKGA